MSLCACGCGRPVPPQRGPGRARKWHSEACRKRQHAQACERCGNPTSHGSESRRVEHPLCGVCIAADRTKAADERAAEFVLLRRDGMLDWQIAELFDISPSAVASALYSYRQRGGTVPPSPYQPAPGWHRRSRVVRREAAVEREQRLLDLAREGAALSVIASEIGVTPRSAENIATRLRKRGVEVPRLRSAA